MAVTPNQAPWDRRCRAGAMTQHQATEVRQLLCWMVVLSLKFNLLNLFLPNIVSFYHPGSCLTLTPWWCWCCQPPSISVSWRHEASNITGHCIQYCLPQYSSPITQSFYVALLFTNVYSFAYKREHPVSNFLDQDYTSLLFVVLRRGSQIRIVKIKKYPWIEQNWDVTTVL